MYVFALLKQEGKHLANPNLILCSELCLKETVLPKNEKFQD